MSLRAFVLACASLGVLAVFLFVSAPPPLPVPADASSARIPVAQAFEMLEAENDAARALWTNDIVTAGKVVGFAFNEHWKEKGVEAGPLPALFLRATAASLERRALRVRLFLGAQAAINPANRFEGAQVAQFEQVRSSRKPVFFFDAETSTHCALFPDIAAVQGCVDCHNKHEASPKKDWVVGDVMGAATWSYPKETVSLEEMRDLLSTLRLGFEDAYSSYLEKAATFAKPPEVGEKWPRDGYYLPSKQVFLEALYRASSAHTVERLLQARPADGGSAK